MAGMFYNLDEVMEKLGKSEADVKSLVKDGKLREFRDGDKQLYKVEDVDAIADTPDDDVSIKDDSLEIAMDESGEISLAPEELDTLMGDSDSDSDNESGFKLDETGELMADEVLDDQEKSNAPAADDDEIELAPAEETADLAGDGDDEISSGDTDVSLSDESINVLSNSDSEFKLTDDTSGETKIMPEGGGALDDQDGDMDIGRLDDDVNLDSFGGSGSGLLDLSLQADDTSLGAVLDDIYPESPAADAAAATPDIGKAETAEAPSQDADIFGQDAGDDMGAPAGMESSVAAAGAAPVAMAVEAPADTASNIFGVMLFIPLIAVIYAAVVVASEYEFIPSLKLLSPLEPIMWYVAGGLMGLVLLMSLIAAASGGSKKPKSKSAKPKKVKKPKAKKAKKKKGKADYQE